MNFLQLCQRCVQECSDAGTLTTTAGQIGTPGRIVNWIGDAWNELQSERDDWNWMRASSILGSGVSFVPLAGQFNVPLGTGSGQIGIDVDSFGKWDEDTFRCYTTGNVSIGVGIGIAAIGSMVIGVGSSGGVPFDETYLECIDFDAWRNAYMLGAQRNVQTRPTVIAIGPDESLNLGPPSNGNYTVTGDYWVAPSLMVNDTDVPIGLPKRWHMLIVYRAMMKYGYFEAAPDVLQRAQFEWDTMYRKLEARRLPRMSFAGALA